MDSIEPNQRFINKYSNEFKLQVIILLILTCTSVYNLTFQKDCNTSLWVGVLGSCLGYVLPNPKTQSTIISEKK